MPRKTNNYISLETAIFLAENRAVFTRIFPNKGGFFETNDGQKKINEKVFREIQQHLKPRN